MTSVNTALIISIFLAFIFTLTGYFSASYKLRYIRREYGSLNAIKARNYFFKLTFLICPLILIVFIITIFFLEGSLSISKHKILNYLTGLSYGLPIIIPGLFTLIVGRIPAEKFRELDN